MSAPIRRDKFKLDSFAAYLASNGAEICVPTNLGSLPASMPDSATLPLDVTFGEMRALKSLLAKLGADE